MSSPIVFTNIFQVRYNFKLQRGELKIMKEYRQTCSIHGGHPVHPTLGKNSGARWMMQGVMRFVRARFYLDKDSKSKTIRIEDSKSKRKKSDLNSNLCLETCDNSKSSPGPLCEHSVTSSWKLVSRNKKNVSNTSAPLHKPKPDHNPQNCEACLFRRCPRPKR